MAFQMSGKFKRVSRVDNKNLLKWTSNDHMLFDEDEEIVAFERKPKGFVEVDKKLKRSKLFLDVNRNNELDSDDQLLFDTDVGYAKKLYKAKKGKFHATNVVADLSGLMGDSIDLSEEIAAGDHSTGRALFNMTKKKGAQLGYVYMGYLDRGYDDILCSGNPESPVSEFC